MGLVAAVPFKHRRDYVTKERDVYDHALDRTHLVRVHPDALLAGVLAVVRSHED